MREVKKYIPLLISFFLILSFSVFFCIKKREVNGINGITLYAACDSSDDTVTAIFMKDFSSRVENYTKGKIKVKTFSNGSVGGDVELLDSVLSGNIDFVFQTSAPQVNTIKEASVFDIPMEYTNIDEARKNVDTKIEKSLSSYYENKGLKLLSISDQGFRVMTANKGIESIGDFKGIKIRTMENKNHISFWRGLGSNPTPMSYAEVYVGLSQGTIDAQENPIEAIVAPRFYEQQKYLIKTNHLLHPILLTASKRNFDRLDYELQKNIIKAAYDSRDYSRKMLDDRDKKNIKVLEKNGIIVQEISNNLREEMHKRSEKTRMNIIKEIGKDLYEKIK